MLWMINDAEFSMHAPPYPQDEADRLSALFAFLLLDTPPEQRFDAIVAFAAHEFEVPIALVSLVDRERQWFKARVGLETCETARDISFCGHAILNTSIMVVNDTMDDSRFFDNPLVTGPPYIRFYAGAPLTMPSGHNIGTLCIIDSRPRTMDAIDLAILTSLRDVLVLELERSGGARDG